MRTIVKDFKNGYTQFSFLCKNFEEYKDKGYCKYPTAFAALLTLLERYTTPSDGGVIGQGVVGNLLYSIHYLPRRDTLVRGYIYANRTIEVELRNILHARSVAHLDKRGEGHALAIAVFEEVEKVLKYRNFLY